MLTIHTLKFPQFLPRASYYLLFLVLFFCPKLWASQAALVMSEKAMIYSDVEMTSVIGYVSRGKKIVVGEIARNKGQLYPIIISGKVAYIRVIDVSTEKESPTSTNLTAERFTKNTNNIPKSKYSLSYFAFNSTIGNTKQNYRVKNNDPFLWQGFSLKGEAIFKNNVDYQFIINYLTTANGKENYKMAEVGGGIAYRLKNSLKWQLRVEGQALLVPFSQYSIGNDFRKNSYGYTLGGGLNLHYLFSESWGVDLNGGLYYSKLLGFKLPPPYENSAPTFIGTRLGAGLTYNY